jgi:Family of unknown function (DUF5996)
MRVSSEHAVYDRSLCEFVLPYKAVRKATDPGEALLSFLRETFDFAHDLASWPEIAV